MPRYTIDYVVHKLIKASKRKTKVGKINDLIDLVFHPLFGETKGVAEIVDFLLHSINEGKLDFRKFNKYNLHSFIYSLIRGDKNEKVGGTRRKRKARRRA